MQIHGYASDLISDECWQQLLQAAVCLCIALLRGDVRVCGDVASSSQQLSFFLSYEACQSFADYVLATTENATRHPKKRQLQRGTYVAEILTHEKVIATTVLPMQTCRIPLSLVPLSLVSIC